MSIVSHQLLGSSPNGNRLDVIYEFTDSSGSTFRYEKLVATDLDTDADMLAMYDNIDASNIESERNYIQGKVDNEEDVLNDILNPVYSTTKELAKSAIRYMMRERDPYIVLTLEPFIDYVRANYNATQLADLLDLTPEQVTKMNTRINAILDNKADFEIYDDNAEDID